MEGTVVGDRYRLGPLLGRGGTSDVYDGHDERLARPVAIKRLRMEGVGDPELRARFEREAQAAGRLAHPNIVAVFDAGQSDGHPYVVMERLTGRSVADSLRDGPLAPERLHQLAMQLLSALAAAHAGGILHRDIKPSNILWAHDGSAKVSDFGIAKGMEHLSRGLPGDPTATNVLVGTPAYLAPERIEGTAATPRSEVWSVGVVLYEALTGVKPFSGDGALGVAYAIMHAEPVPLEELRPGVDPGWATVVHRALNKDPKQRFASATEMGEALGMVPPRVTEAVHDPPGPDEHPETTPIQLGYRLASHRSPRLKPIVQSAAAWAGWQRLFARSKRSRLAGVAAVVAALLAVGLGLQAASTRTSASRPATGGRPATTTTPPATTTSSPPPQPPTAAAPPSSVGPASRVALPEPSAPSVPAREPKAGSTTAHAHHHDQGGQGDGGNNRGGG